MKITTALNHERRLVGLAGEVYFLARLSGSTHESLLERLQARVYSDPAWPKVPAWVQAKVFAVAWQHDFYRPSLHAKEFERMLADSRDGKPVKPAAYLRWQHRIKSTGERVSSSEVSERGCWAEIESAHVWNHKPEDHAPFSPWVGF